MLATAALTMSALEQRDTIATAHRTFLNRFHRDHSHTPLLEYDREAGATAPFSEVDS